MFLCLPTSQALKSGLVPSILLYLQCPGRQIKSSLQSNWTRSCCHFLGLADMIAISPVIPPFLF